MPGTRHFCESLHCGALLPVVVEAIGELRAAQGDDCIGAVHGPEHTRAFQAGTDHAAASGFNHTGADEQILTAELVIPHALGMAFKVGGLALDRRVQLGRVAMDAAQGLDQMLDAPLVELLLAAASSIAPVYVVERASRRGRPSASSPVWVKTQPSLTSRVRATAVTGMPVPSMAM